MEDSPQSFYIENLGCSKNQVDAEVMIASLKKAGWTYLPEQPENADLIIVNTCGFIKSAQEESVNTLLGVQNEYPQKKVIAAGCLAQRWSGDLPRLIPELDGVFGNRAPGRIDEAANDAMAGRRPVLTPEFGQAPDARNDFFGFKRSVYVKIADGCNHRCRFCAIPLIKGPLYSRPVDDVVQEVKKLVTQGQFEINLVAQDLGAYGADRGRRNLETLLKRLLDLTPDPFWIRLLYLHPDHFSKSLLDLMTSDPRLLPYLDIPFQHASVPVLRKMGRSGSAEAYLDLVQNIRERLPDSVIRTTFLTGHPGEGRREFAELLRFQEQARPDWAGVFCWSREEGTAAASDKGAISARLGAFAARKRKEELETRQKVISEEQMDRWIGREITVLTEEPVEGEELALGRAPMHAPEVDGNVVLHMQDAVPGQVVQAKISGRSGIDLQAVPAGGAL